MDQGDHTPARANAARTGDPDRVRHGIEAAEAIVSLAEGVLHGGKEVEDTEAEELVRRARAFGSRQPAAGPMRDAQRSLSNAAQALSDAARFERDRKRSRSPDGQKRNLLARNMALTTAKLNAAMAGMHLSAPGQGEAQGQLHELNEAVSDLSRGMHETTEEVANPHAPAPGDQLAEPDEPQPKSSIGSRHPTLGRLEGRPGQHNDGGQFRRRRRGGQRPRRFRGGGGGPPRKH